MNKWVKDWLQRVYECNPVEDEPTVAHTIREKKEQYFMQGFLKKNPGEPEEILKESQQNGEILEEDSLGRNFSLFENLDESTIVYEVVERYDEKRMMKICELDRLVRSSEPVDDQRWKRTYYISPVKKDGNSLVFLHFKSKETIKEIFINTGMLINEDVKITTKPLFAGSSSITYGDNLLNNPKYSLEKLTEKERYQLEDDGIYYDEDIGTSNYFIIDLENLESPKREVYLDNEKQQWAVRIKMKKLHGYLICAVVIKGGSNEEPLTNLEIGSAYRTGSHGFPQNLMKAGEYLEQDGSAEALYQIAQMFLEEDELRDLDIAISYLQRAADMGNQSAKEALEKLLS